MSGISFSGLASGIDFDSLRSALLSVERQSLKRITDKQDRIEQQRDAFNDINSRLANLKTKLSPLLATGTSNLFSQVSASSSNTSVFSATATSSAAAGTYDIRVKNLALAESVISAQGSSVGSFTSSIGGTDLNADIDAATTLVGSLHRRDTSASFVDGDLGQMMIDDGVTGAVNVDLSLGVTSASTFSDLTTYINGQLAGAGSAVTASVNATGDGILFSSGTGNVSIADGGDGKTTATKFGVATAGLVAAPVDGGDLDADLQRDTPLAKLNSGAGVADLASGFKIRNGSSSVTVDVSASATVSDILAQINGAGISATAAIDAAKNGLSVTSTVANRSLAIEENGGSTAVNLGIFGDSNVLQLKTAADASYFKVYLNGSYDGDSANLSLEDIRDSINAVSGKTFSASVVDSRLSFQSDKSGVANALQVKDTEVGAGILEQLGILDVNPADDSTISNAFAGNNALGGYLQTATNAVFSVNGLQVSRASNTGITDVITGVTLNLAGASASSGPAFPTDYTSSSLTISKNTTSMANSIEEFVNQFNSVVEFINTSAQVNPDGDDGILAGNSIARSLRDSLVSRASQLNPDLGQTFRSLFDMKDSEGNAVFELTDSKSGQITLNKTALTNLLNEDPDSVSDVLRYDSDADGVYDGGIAHALNVIVESYNKTNTGIIASQVTSYEDQIDDLDDQLLRMNETLEKRDALLKKQFSSAEQLISQMQSQGNYLSSQLAGFAKR